MSMANLRCQKCLKIFEMPAEAYHLHVGEYCECGHPLWTAEEQEVADVIMRNETKGADLTEGMTSMQVKIARMWAAQAQYWKMLDYQKQLGLMK